MCKADQIKKVKKCSNCGEAPRGKGKIVRGLCPACRIYEYRHGRPRKPENKIRWRNDPRPLCRRCKQSRATNRRGGLCNACWQYQNAHGGKQRPSYLWAEKCNNCGRPRDRTTALIKGLCRLCYQYQKKFGRPRPFKELDGLTDLGWCDCGQPATHPNSYRGFVMNLCDDCYKVENSCLMKNTQKDRR